MERIKTGISNLFRNYSIKDYKFSLIFLVTAITVIGIMVIGSADPDYQRKQTYGLIAGLCIMFVISLIDYHFVLKFYWLIYALAIVLLGMVLVSGFGSESTGADRWISIGGFQFQPSELVKILMILFLARYFFVYQEKMQQTSFVLITLVLILIPIFMILKQPDLSTAVVLCAVLLVIFFLAGLPGKWIKIALCIGIPVIAVFFYLVTREGQTLISEYQAVRILAWLYPDEYPQSALQQQNSITAVASGQLLGKGLYNTDANSVKNGNFISEAQTDFIFAVVGEELGFVGCCLVIGLLLLISLMCIRIGVKAKDFSGKLIGCGMGCLIALQTFVNISVVVGLLPNTGLPLPFVSYGLTSLISLFIGIGFVLNVGLNSAKDVKEGYIF